MGRIAALFLTAAAIAACAYEDYHRDGYGRYAGGVWDGSRPAYEGELRGPGIGILDRWLLETPEGQAIVTTGFRGGRRGFVSEDLAHRANIWFRRYADQDRDMVVTDPEIRAALVAASTPPAR